MNEVSLAYKQAVYAPSRKTIATVQFDILDNTAYDDNTYTVTSEAEISRLTQMDNKVRRMSSRYATFEKDYWRLDGTFCLPPKKSEAAADGLELGWWSNTLSDANGAFTPAQVVTSTFTNDHSTAGITIAFDPATDEYAADFDIDVFNGVNTVIDHLSVTGNTKNLYVYRRGLDKYRKIVITIRKWAKPYRRARITEIDFGLVEVYTGEKLIKMNLIEEMNVTGDTIPANELKFTVDNTDREFNILNPEGFYKYLNKRQEVNASIGVEIAPDVFEYIDIKKYYLTDWQSNEGALTTTFTARDALEMLDQYEYNTTYTGTLYGLASDVLTKAGITGYYLDPVLQDIPTTGFPAKINSRKAMQCIGIASQCAVYQARSGDFNVRQFKELDARTTYIQFAGEPDMYAGIAYVATDSGYLMKNISFDNVYAPPQIKLSKLIKALTINVYSGSSKTEYLFPNVGVEEGTALKLDNPLIQSLTLAHGVAAWLLSESNQRALYSVNWRQNPALEPGDIVIVEDSFGAKKQSRITKQEFEYAGYLSGKTETKGGI
ncbi:hypothetical protein [Paenibacillus sp. FSL E2-0190]|uniref:hypothetical protein n=1 Tax=Paenibacillus sp. FSL E2-0190 TaxID=2954504 RepID=UPI0030EECEA7